MTTTDNNAARRPEVDTAAFDDSVHRRDGAVLLVIVLGVLVAAGLLLDSVTRPVTRITGKDPAAAAAAAAPGVSDDFARSSADGLGATPGGRRWQTWNGQWRVAGGTASVQSPQGVALALVGASTAQGRVEVTAARMGAGFGLAFRCRNPENCWRLEAVPGFGTWNVVRVVDGNEQKVLGLGTVPVADGTRVGVEMHGEHLEFFVNGTSVGRVDDGALARDTRYGLSLREASGAATARWSKLVMTPGLSAGLDGLADAPVRDTFDRADAPTLGAATGGPWTSAAGTWGVSGHTARLTRKAAAAPSLALLDAGSGDATVQVGFLSVQNGSGIAFRCKDQRNCWTVTASLPFATWNIDRIVDGRRTRIGNLGLSSTDAGTMLAVRLEGPSIVFSVDGKQAASFTDPALASEHGVGLAAVDERFVTDTQWAEIRVRAGSAR